MKRPNFERTPILNLDQGVEDGLENRHHHASLTSDASRSAVMDQPTARRKKLLIWAKKRGITIQHIQPGQPHQNAYFERYNRTVRHEWHDHYIIETIKEEQNHVTQWLWTYNNDRPNMGIGGITPAQKLKMAAEILRIHPVKKWGVTDARSSQPSPTPGVKINIIVLAVCAETAEFKAHLINHALTRYARGVN